MDVGRRDLRGQFRRGALAGFGRRYGIQLSTEQVLGTHGDRREVKVLL